MQIDALAKQLQDATVANAAGLASHTHSFPSLTSKPTTIEGFGIIDAYTRVETDGKIAEATAALADSAPELLNTLAEFAAALGNDPNFATTISTSLSLKLNASAYMAADVLAKLRTVDGSGSGLDADTVRGFSTSADMAANTLAARDASGDSSPGFSVPNMPRQRRRRPISWVSTRSVPTRRTTTSGR